MAFVSLFSSPPNKGLRVADTSASNEREKAEADINCEGIRATKKKKKKRKKKKNNKWGRNGMINMSTRTGQQEEQEERWQRDSSLQLDKEHRPRVQRTEWHWDYNSEDTISQSVNPRKRKQQSNDHGRPERDFASELDQYRQMREALPPPSPPFPFPPQQTRGLSQEKEMNMRGQKNPKETWIHKINRGMPGPGQRGRAQSGRGRRGMSRGRGSRNNNNKPDGRHCGKGRGLSGGKVEALPKEERKKPFLSQDFLDQHTLEVQGRHICKYFLRGACIKGDKCHFEHDTNVKMMQLCKFYVQGYCAREDCIYMHNEFPCKFFHTGAKCYQGDACRFSHEPLTDHTRELLEQFLNSEPVKKEEPDRMEQDDCSSPLPPSPLPPVAKLTVDLAYNVVNVRSNFYNSSPLTECQLQGSSTLPQSRACVNIHGEKLTIPTGSPGLERRSEMHTCSPTVPDSKMESPAVQDDLISSSVEACPGAVTSVLKTLFLHLNPTDEEPQNSGTETGVSGSDEGVYGQPAALKAKKRQMQGTVPTKQETNVCDWLVEAEAQSGQCPARSEGESAPLCKPLFSEDREWEVGQEGRLRDEPALMPLEAIPGMARRDPRSVPCAVSVTLPLPTFAHTVEWSTEEPMPLPPQVDTSPQSISPTPHFQRPLVDTPEHSSSWIPPRNLPQVVSSAVHKLPVPALGGLIHPTYTKGRGVNPEGGDHAARETETETKGNVLKGLFKTLLPVSDL